MGSSEEFVHGWWFLRHVIDEELCMSATAAFEAHYCNEDMTV